MGDPVGRVPGPLGMKAGGLSDVIDTVVAFIRDLKLVPVKGPAAWAAKLPLLDPAATLSALRDIFGPENWEADGRGQTDNNRDPANTRLPSARRERDATRPTGSVSVRLTDPDWSIDRDGTKLTGRVSATVVIPTPYGTFFDSPTPIRLSLDSVQLGATDLSLGGFARAYKVVRADWNLRLHYDPNALLRAAVTAARGLKLGRGELEGMLKDVGFDFSAVIKAGIPLSWVWASASSLLPLRRPLHGALDRLLPVQVAAMPDSKLLMAVGLLLPKGVAFSTTVPGVGVHYSRYGTRQGGSVTAGAVTYPKLTELGKPGVTAGKLFPIFGHLDLAYVRRVSNTVDLGFGLTYSYSPTPGGGGGSDGPVSEYLPGLTPADYRGTAYQPWNPVNQENIAPDEAVSKHRLTFRIFGTHDLLGGGN